MIQTKTREKIVDDNHNEIRTTDYKVKNTNGIGFTLQFVTFPDLNLRLAR